MDDQNTCDNQLYAVLCDYYWYAARGITEMDGNWHRDEQGECFADRVMEFIKQELDNPLQNASK